MRKDNIVAASISDEKCQLLRLIKFYDVYNIELDEKVYSASSDVYKDIINDIKNIKLAKKAKHFFLINNKNYKFVNPL